MARSKQSKAPQPIEETEAEASETYWAARKILSERRIRGVTQYLVDWEGIDPDTGKPYDPSWVSLQIMLTSISRTKFRHEY